MSIFGRVTLKYFFPTSLSLFFLFISQTHSLPPQVQSHALARALLRQPSAILSFSCQHSSNLIDHNMAPLPLCCVGHFRNLSTPFFPPKTVSLSSTKLRCCTVYKPKRVEKKKKKQKTSSLLFPTTISTLPSSSPPCLSSSSLFFCLPPALNLFTALLAMLR